ncbi:MAG: hypothetical protein ACRDTE_23965 [Pseudonocardiaceae bacterium]
MTQPARLHHRARIAARLTALSAVAVLALLSGADLPAIAQDTARQDRVTTWLASLVPDGDDTNVRAAPDGLRLDSDLAGPTSSQTGRAHGMLITTAQPLAELGSQVAAELVADQPAGSAVDVDVRGTRGDGSWTEWMPTGPNAPAMLNAAVTSVQARVVLQRPDGGASPVVRSLRLTAQPGVQLFAARPRNAHTYRVFATREGLVGGTTANGHVIRERDHFVALPSRRGLAPRGSGDYTVKICSDRGRCEWAPVWDVGPWNTTDDYWNPADTRQSWQDLPQGQPQAQAAHDDGYNKGLDQYDREVANPAGIDLADGTFWDGLGLRDNSWVTVTYLWTDGGPLAIVRMPLLHVRSGPGAHHPAVGLAAQRATLRVECAVLGPLVNGTQGSTDQWLRIGPDQYVSAAHVNIQGAQATGMGCASP